MLTSAPGLQMRKFECYLRRLLPAVIPARWRVASNSIHSRQTRNGLPAQTRPHLRRRICAVHDGWVVLVRGEKIEAVGRANEIKVPANAKIIELPGMTLMPGLIDAHSHVLLHPYSETSWNDQVAREALSLRVARATNHLRHTLQAGFTTFRDLGTEGAGYADVGLKQSVEQGIIPGPRLIDHYSRDCSDGHLWSKGLRFGVECASGR